MAIKKTTTPDTIIVEELQKDHLRFRIIGETGLYMNSMAIKAKRDLLIGSKRKTAAEKKEIKHDPESEFRSSMHTQKTGPTLLCFDASGVKAAMGTAAIETPGVAKTSVNRNIFVGGDITGKNATEHTRAKISIYGKPYLKIDVVRCADMNRTPDIRTRAFLPRWCAELEIRYTLPTFGPKSIASLLVNAGLLVGIGDFRQEKGKGGYGVWKVCTKDSMGNAQAEWDEITKEARKVQQEAYDNPECYDDETQQLVQMVIDEQYNRQRAA